MILEELKEKIKNPPALSNSRKVKAVLRGHQYDNMYFDVVDVEFDYVTGGARLILDQFVDDFDWG